MSSWGTASDAPRADGHETPGAGDAGDAATAGDPAEAGGLGDAGDAAPVDEAGDADARAAADAPGGDSLPSTESLRWAPDATAPLPSEKADPTVPLPSEAPDPTAPLPGPPDSRGYSGHPGPVGSPAYSGQPGSRVPGAYPGSPGPPAHLARRPRHPGRHGAWRRWRADPVALGAIGALVAIVVVAAILITRDGNDRADPEESATPALVAGDGTDPAGPIVGPTGVIGSWSGSEWVPRPDGEQPGAGLDYMVLGLGEASGTAHGEAVAEDCLAQRATSEVDVGVDLDAGGGGDPPPIAVAGVADPRPRAIEQLGTASEVYRQAAADVGAGLGATTPPTVTAVLRADLDGDGTLEVVVAAEHISDPEDLTPAPGDWSAAFLRRVVGNDVATDVLASSVVGGAGDQLDRVRVATLADLNGDGTMEVALDGRSSTGEWTSIHALGGDGVASEVLRAGCDG